MPRKPVKIAPSRDSAAFEDVQVLHEAGAVGAHGVPHFPVYVTVQLDDPDLDYRLVLHVQTTPRGSEVVGFQLAPRPYAPLVTTDFPSVFAVARQFDHRPYLQTLIAAIKADQLGINWNELIDAEGQPHGEGLRRLQEVFDEARSARPRRYRPRHGATLEQVAAVYRLAFESAEHPTRAVQEKCGPMGYSTASALVREARAAGLLPPATKGKPGWTEGE